MTDCPRCAHPLATHGSGCTRGWFSADGEHPCHCPNNSDGRVATACALVGCDQGVTHVDRFGQFYCAGHAGQGRGVMAIDDVKVGEWQ